MKMTTQRDWLIRRADQEDRHFISAGGLVSRIEEGVSLPQRAKFMRAAFLVLLQMSRRERKLTVAQFAQKSDIDVAELILLDNNPTYMPTPRTVHRLSSFLNIPAKTLMILAGLAETRDNEFDEVALQFAANSESTAELTDQQEKTLREFVRFLCEHAK